MIKNIVWFGIGFLMMVIGGSYFWLYLNLLTFGYSLTDYFLYLLGRFETYIFIVGFLLVLQQLIRKEKK